MAKTRTLSMKTPDDMLAAVPYVLGFHPEDSLVLLTVGDAVDRFHARVDLPDDPDDVPAVLEMITDAVTHNGVRRVAIVVYSDDELVAPTVCEPLLQALEGLQVSVADAIRADGSRWYSLTGCSGTCCPAEGTPYDVSTHPFTAQSVLDGQVTLPSRAALVDTLVGEDPEALTAVEVAADKHDAKLRASARHPLGAPSPEGARRHLVQEGHWVGERVCAFLADGEALSHDDAGRMLVAMTAIEIRDVAWAEMTRGNAGKHVDLWRDLVRRAPDDLVAGPAALLGFSAWLSGDGALAWCAVDRCQSAEPGYSLAGLLSQALAGAVPPSAWRPVRKSDLTLFAS